MSEQEETKADHGEPDRATPKTVVQLGQRSRRIIGGVLFAIWLAVLALIWVLDGSSAMRHNLFLAAVAGGPVLMAMAFNLAPWTSRRRRREGLSSAASILITEVQGWHVSHHVKVSLVMLVGGDILWIFPTDEKLRAELRALLADSPIGRLRLHGTTPVGPGGMTALGLPLIVLALFLVWNATSDTFAPTLVLILIGPLALLFSYVLLLLILLWPENLAVPSERELDPLERSASAQQVQIEQGGQPSTPGELRLSETVGGTITRWSLRPSAVFTSEERAALGLNEAEVLKTIIEERAQAPQTVYRA